MGVHPLGTTVAGGCLPQCLPGVWALLELVHGAGQSPGKQAFSTGAQFHGHSNGTLKISLPAMTTANAAQLGMRVANWLRRNATTPVAGGLATVYIAVGNSVQ